MKARIEVVLNKGVFDPQGKTIVNALHHLDHHSVKDVKVGKVFYVDLDEKNPADAETKLSKMADELFANPIIEDFTVEILKD